ncbi:MarR family winged helix-turn-helix transcriptional regulator [Paenibacillus lignilyticus]|uniref:Winged helix DNA-binding protein n=1 Tax=Paenibacillus lignilyticus TaxID=1172615 RepID=A0ABS5CGF3_9BACL|nr:MarR family transcriptional regulator [Paenibacillus lignilyticus]MBP3964897.1 winged helix DNA-binding protein [Paenibacillus lignilyticus]
MQGDNEHDRGTAHQLIRAFRQLKHIPFKNRNPIENCTPSETMTLFTIGGAMRSNPAGLKASELSSLMNVASPTITQTVNVLTARGLLERSADPSDRRVVRIKLTEEGARLTGLARAAMHARMNGLIEHLGEDRAALLVELLDDVFAFYHGERPEEYSVWCKDNPSKPIHSEEGE